MARILVTHVPKDGSIARELGAALMGRGHFVSFDGEPDAPRPDRATRLRQFEAVVVIWTESSAPSPGLAEIAQETLPLNLLVPVRAEDLTPARLPLMFRKLNAFTPRDVDGIARVVARLAAQASSLREMAEREQARRTTDAPGNDASRVGQRAVRPAAPAASVIGAEGATVRVRPLSGLPEVEANLAEVRPAARAEQRPALGEGREPIAGGAARGVRPSAPQPGDGPHAPMVTAEDLARAVDAGLLVHHIPDAMWLGAPTVVELTLGREILAGLMRAEVGHGSATGAERQSVETLSVSLYGSAEAFEIERQSERTQFVSGQPARDPATYGRWAWRVTPRAAGPQDLIVRVTALLRDRSGVPAPVALPDRRFTIDIRVSDDTSVISALAGWQRR